MPDSPPDAPLLAILPDQPADEDQPGFPSYARTLADILADPGTRTPLTIGVFGDWGRGKTSLMRSVQRRLEEGGAPRFPVRTVWFYAWLYSREQALCRALISRVLDRARVSHPGWCRPDHPGSLPGLDCCAARPGACCRICCAR